MVNTATALAQVHVLTELLDDLRAQQWLKENACYICCWRKVADSAARHRQLNVVQLLGQALDRLTRQPGLRTLLRLMRGPADAAGLSALQHFLDAGFDAFATVRGADEFLLQIQLCETEWIQSLIKDALVTCETKLTHLMTPNSPH